MRTAVAPVQPDDSRPCIGGPIACQPPAHEADNLDQPLDIPIGKRRWCAVRYSDRTSHGQKMVSKEFSRFLRSESNFHDVDGASVEKFTKIAVHGSEINRRSVVGAFLNGLEQSPF